MVRDQPRPVARVGSDEFSVHVGVFPPAPRRPGGCDRSPCRCGPRAATPPFLPSGQRGTEGNEWLLLPGKSQTGGGDPPHAPGLSAACWRGRLSPEHLSLRKGWELRLSASVGIRIFQRPVVPDGVVSLLCLFIFAMWTFAQSSQPFEKEKVTVAVADGALAGWAQLDGASSRAPASCRFDPQLRCFWEANSH